MTKPAAVEHQLTRAWAELEALLGELLCPWCAAQLPLSAENGRAVHRLDPDDPDNPKNQPCHAELARRTLRSLRQLAKNPTK